MKRIGTCPASRISVIAVTLLTLVVSACVQTGREVQNVRAFAKLYGYVKYFHPSDEASAITWDAFAVYGAEQVRRANNAEELKVVLESLFLPIAPTLQIYLAADEPPVPPTLVPDDTSGLVLVAWQHRGVSLGTMASSPVYQSARLNRRNRVPGSRQAFGNVVQSLEATRLLSREIRLRAFVRTEVTGSGNQGQLWLRVDREGNQQGFFDNMGDRPIRSSEWESYEIIGDVAADATNILVGCFLRGSGTLWVDDFQLQVRNEQGGWDSVELENPGFEEVDERGAAAAWSTRSQGYEYRIDTNIPHNGEHALVVESAEDEGEWFTGELFDEHATPGEAIEKDLGAGLSARIPLALFSNSMDTMEDPDTEAFRSLAAALEAIDVESLTADDAAVRLGAVIVTWNVLQHFYPYFDIVDTDWDLELTEALEGALEDRTGEDFYSTLGRLIASLHDGHGNVYHSTYSSSARVPFLVDWVQNEVVVTVTVPGGELLPGDVINAIDGAMPEQVLLDAERYISGSPQWMRYRALRQFGNGEEGTEAVLRVQRVDSTFETRVTRVSPSGSIQERTGESIREIGDGVVYVDLNRAEMPEISERMAQIAAARGVVFDLRGYPRGNHAVIGHLLQVSDTSDAWMRVLQMVYPDHENPVGMENHGWGLAPLEPHIGGEVVFLTDGRAISYAESFMSFIEHYQLAEIVGQPTAGANGNVNPFQVPGGFRVTWTGMRVVKHDGTRHHTIGVLPTISFWRTIQGIREGRDELLDKALEVINERTR